MWIVFRVDEGHPQICCSEAATLNRQQSIPIWTWWLMGPQTSLAIKNSRCLLLEETIASYPASHCQGSPDFSLQKECAHMCWWRFLIKHVPYTLGGEEEITSTLRVFFSWSNNKNNMGQINKRKQPNLTTSVKMETPHKWVKIPHRRCDN